MASKTTPSPAVRRARTREAGPAAPPSRSSRSVVRPGRAGGAESAAASSGGGVGGGRGEAGGEPVRRPLALPAAARAHQDGAAEQEPLAAVLVRRRGTDRPVGVGYRTAGLASRLGLEHGDENPRGGASAAQTAGVHHRADHAGAGVERG